MGTPSERGFSIRKERGQYERRHESGGRFLVADALDGQELHDGFLVFGSVDVAFDAEEAGEAEGVEGEGTGLVGFAFGGELFVGADGFDDDLSSSEGNGWSSANNLEELRKISACAHDSSCHFAGRGDQNALAPNIRANL
jgi:hypothetical protein